MDPRNNKPFEFKYKKKNNYAEKSYKYYRRRALQKVYIETIQVQDKKKLRRIVKLRRIHLERYISVKHNGGKWWNRWMAIYFGDVSQEDIVNCKNNTTSDVILHFQEVRGKTKSYQDLFIYKSQPLLGDPNTLKFLLHGIYYNKQIESEQTEDEDIYELLIFNYQISKEEGKEYCQIADPDAVVLAPTQKPSVIKVEQIEKELDLRASYRINARLQFKASVTNSSVLYNCLFYQERLKRNQYNHLDCEISLLSEQLVNFHQQNTLIWNNAIEQCRKQRDHLTQLSRQCAQIESLQTMLACRDRLLYFKKGFKDKTEDQLQEALEELQLEEKRLLYSRRNQKDRLASYNDCKVCFYPEVKQGNEIVFCNICHISYHKHCYGLNALIDQQTYICDACFWMEENDIEQENHDLRPNCSICYSRIFFPLKKVGNQFYHITCLFFHNFADVSSLAIKLKPEAGEQIRQRGRTSQASRCMYCLPHSEYPGICLKCEVQNCQINFHAICGYLRGCSFNITRPEQLCVLAKCHEHSYGGYQDEELRQVYIRRFFCNFQNIQPLTELQFKPLYQDEKLEIQIERRKLLQNHISWQDYDHVRKRAKLADSAPTNDVDYDSMTVEELLSFSRGQQLQKSQKEEQFFQVYPEKETEEAHYTIIID